MKWALSALLLVGAAPVWADVSQLRDQLMSADPAVVDQAAKEVDALSARDKRMLVLSLMIPLRRDPGEGCGDHVPGPVGGGSARIRVAARCS